MWRNKLFVIGVVVVVLGLLAANSLFVVHQTQQAIREEVRRNARSLRTG